MANVINIEANPGTSIDLATQDEALIVPLKNQALAGVIINTDNSAAIQLKNGSDTGAVLATVAATAGVGTTVDFFNVKFPDGIFFDAGGAATGLVTVVHWSYVKGIPTS